MLERLGAGVCSEVDCLVSLRLNGRKRPPCRPDDRLDSHGIILTPRLLTLLHECYWPAPYIMIVVAIQFGNSQEIPSNLNAALFAFLKMLHVCSREYCQGRGAYNNIIRFGALP